MKARVKATGEIVEVNECGQAFKDMRMDYMDTRGRCYSSEDLDFTDNTPFDYWTRLEHQYAGMAMQGMMAEGLRSNTSYISYGNIVEFAMSIAHALVEKYKKEKK